MPVPRVSDDGTCITLDLHGASVSEAAVLTRKLLQKALSRGRGTVKIIHGSSTTTADTGRETIKSTLHALFDGGHPGVASVLRSDDYLLVALTPSTRKDTTPVTLRDLSPF